MRIKNPLDVLAPIKGRTQPRHCDVAGCTESTREGKPYCPDHVDHNPYVQELIAKLDERDEQDERVRRRGHKVVDMDSVTVAEILLHLELHGARTEERLVRELNLGLDVLQPYLRALAKRGLVKFGRTRRGSTLLKLTGQTQPLIPNESKPHSDEVEVHALTMPAPMTIARSSA